MTAATTKGRPAATGRPLTPESRSNGSKTNDAPAKGHTMFQNQGTYAKAELRSTTGTAPIKFQRTDGNGVLIQLEDGSTQLYDRRNLMIAVLGLWEGDQPGPTISTMVRASEAVTGDGLGLWPERLSVTWTGGPDSRQNG